MQVGDKVIINPNIPDGSYSKYGYGFYHDTMRKPGIFTLNETTNGGFKIGDYHYDEEWLLPVPLFNVGDEVKIREDLSMSDHVPYSVNKEMEKLAGRFLKVNRVKLDRDKVIGLGDDGYLYHLYEDKSWSWSSPMFDISNYKLKIKSDESKLCNEGTPFRGVSDKDYSGLRSRFNKARITVVSLGYQEVTGRG